MSNDYDYIRAAGKRKRKHSSNKPSHPALMSGALPSPTAEEAEEVEDDAQARKKVKKEHKKRKHVGQLDGAADAVKSVPAANGDATQKLVVNGDASVEDEVKARKKAKKELKKQKNAARQDDASVKTPEAASTLEGVSSQTLGREGDASDGERQSPQDGESGSKKKAAAEQAQEAHEDEKGAEEQVNEELKKAAEQTDAAGVEDGFADFGSDEEEEDGDDDMEESEARGFQQAGGAEVELRELLRLVGGIG